MVYRILEENTDLIRGYDVLLRNRFETLEKAKEYRLKAIELSSCSYRIIVEDDEL